MRETFAEVTLAPAGARADRAELPGHADAAHDPPRRARARLSSPTPARWHGLPDEVLEWLRAAARALGACRRPTSCWSRPSRAAGAQFLVAYCFVGWNAHQTLGMLLTRRMERLGLRPLGFVASDYVLAIWSLEPVTDPAALFDVDMLGDELEDWMAEFQPAASAPSATSR